jgi:predicted nuclease of predicted toxin-antitoxin system
MRILLDECVPGPMRKLLGGQSCSTVQELGWGGIKNGDLLQRAEGEFDLFITSDQNLRYQQSRVPASQPNKCIKLRAIHFLCRPFYVPIVCQPQKLAVIECLSS